MNTEARDWPRLVFAAAVVVYFGYALGFHWTNGIEETLKNITMLVVGYFFGSSKGSSDKDKLLADSPTGTPADPVSVTPAPDATETTQ